MRARARGIAQSYPINLDDLTARLEGISADKQAPPRLPSPASTEDLGEEEYYRLDLEEETEYYNTLVNEGGRPSHPVSLGQNIIEDPGEYREILSYWQRGENDWKVFGSQMGEWREFRRWQRKNREDGRFPKYVEGVKQGLAEHGFTRSFELDADPERQDKLTTWVEFLDYEYWWYDIDMRFVKRLQPQYDEAWKELTDTQVLRPDETEEFICNIDSAFQHASERERAERAVEAAKWALISAQKAITDPRRSSLSEPEAQQRLAAAQSKLDAAVKSLESIKRRNDLVYEFFKKIKKRKIAIGKLKKSYLVAKRDAQRRSILLRWILQQIPLIELELNQFKVAENDSRGENGKKRLKSNPADDLGPERVSKRRREDDGNNVLSDRRPHASTAPTSSQDSSTQRPPQTAGRNGQLKFNSYDSTSGGRAAKRCRYSSQTSSAAEPISIGKPLSTQLDRSEPDNNVARVPQKQRTSRRIAGHLPEFGILLKRDGPVPPYESPMRRPSNTRKPNPSSTRKPNPSSTRKPNPSSTRSRTSSKKSIVKGVKPQGISKSRRETQRSRRSKKGLGS
ncbi:hypothetical protein BDZ45DRAFT_422902 [Acephala macrosclerotiorum]|nr:hypothetical protein BDZ45DRAFT_422902 [Acephala macrosclerotiorum]